MTQLSFKAAETPSELQQVHNLNHRIFAEEIGQHPRQPSGLLIDRLHHQNHYFLALRTHVVVGMISAHGGPEFSIAKRLAYPALLEALGRPLEIRLLAIEPGERHRTVLAGLFWQVYSFAVENGYSHLLISAITSRQKMYQRLGFVPIGPPIPEAAAEFVPMVMAVSDQTSSRSRRVALYERRWRTAKACDQPVSLMPGPVSIHPRVSRAFGASPISHRSGQFAECYCRVTKLLRNLSNGLEAVILPGAGTLANDAVAANLKAIFKAEKGLVLSNGEFGERLSIQAWKAGLNFRTLQFAWGQPWSLERISEALADKPAWIWAVQLETSTGVLNDTNALLELAGRQGCQVALDCVSSIGAVEFFSGRGVPPLFASGVSGKSIGSYAGLAFVYLSENCRRLLADRILCPSFDLLAIHQMGGPVSTVSSSSFFALARALEDNYGTRQAAHERFDEYRLLGSQIRHQMKAFGLKPLVCDDIAAPNITTFRLPDPLFPEKCLSAGYRIAFESPYLRMRDWGQIATMGNVDAEAVRRLFERLRAN